MRRLASIAAIALLAALLPAAAARAAPGETMRLPGVSVVPGGETRETWAVFSALRNNQPAPFTLEFDIAAASRIATVEAGPRCTATATRISCPFTRAFSVEQKLSVTAKPDAEPGATAAIPVRAMAAGTLRASATGRVTIAEGVALAATQLQADVTVPTGATTPLAAGVRNTGDRPVTGLILALRTGQGFAIGRQRNCAGIDHGFACRFPSELAPGQEYRLATPLRLIAADEIWAPSKWNARLEWWTEQDWADAQGPLRTGTSGPELELVPVGRAAAVPQTAGGPSSDPFSLTVTGSNRSNITAIGARSTAKPGDTITVRVGVRNNGPARLEGYGSELGSYLTVGVTPPAGTTVVGTPKRCMPWNDTSPVPPPWPPGASSGDGNLYCFSDEGMWSPYFPGETTTWEIKLRVDRPGTLRGKIFTRVVAPSSAPQGDTDASDDAAAIVITATATGGTGSGGGGEGGGLPITGSNAELAALIGLTLLLAGAVARMTARRG